MTRRLALYVCLAVIAACRDETAQSLDVGEHHVQLVVPTGWERIDQGSQVLLRRGSDQLVLTDLGPSRPSGFRAEVLRARELWNNGRYREALTRLEQIPRAQELFATEADEDAFREAWNEVAYSPSDSPWSAVDAQFEELLTVIATMEAAPIDAVAAEAAERLEHLDHRRELKSTETRRIGGREAAVVTTWMTLSHADERRLVLVINDGRSLVLRCDRCDPPVPEVLDAVAASLHFGSDTRR